jgi:DHA2 family multidrug resistance protein
MHKRSVTPSHRIRRFVRKRDSVIHPQHDSYKWVLLANIMLGTFMAVLDSTIVNVGLPKIMSSFGTSLDKIEWVITAYMLSMAVMLPITGWFADRFGYKRMYFLGLLFFTLGSFLCGMSTNEDMLIISRIVQGLGAGAIQPLGMAIITREFPPHQRGVAIGFWSIAAAASVSFGPLIGGYLVDNFSWQLIFDVNVPVGLAAMLATLIIQQEYKNKTIRKFDYTGFASVAIFLPLTLFALAQGNAATNSDGWNAPYILLCFAIALVALVVFITTELTVSDPMIDLRLLGNRNFGLCNLVLLIFSIGMFGSTFLLPLYLQNSLGYTAVQSGSVFLPVGILQGIIAPISGKLSTKVNPKFFLLLGVSLLSASFLLNSELSFLSEHQTIMLSLYIRGLGMGMIFTPLSTISLSQIPREKMAQASGITNTIRQLGGSLGVAILATMLTARVSFHSQVFSESVNQQSQEFKTTVNNLSTYARETAGSSPAQALKQGQSLMVSHLSKQAYIQGIDDDFYLAAFITLSGAFPVLFLLGRRKPEEERKKKLRKEIS